MTFSKMMLSTIAENNGAQHNCKGVKAALLSMAMKPIILNVIMLSGVMLSVIMPSVLAPFKYPEEK